MVDIGTFNNINIIIYKRQLFVNNINGVCMSVNAGKYCSGFHKKYIIAVFQSELRTVNTHKYASAIGYNASYALHKKMTIRKIKCTIRFIKKKQWGSLYYGACQNT